VIVDSYISMVDFELQRALEEAGIDAWIISSNRTHPQYRNTSIKFNEDEHKQLKLESFESPIISLNLYFPFPILKRLIQTLEKVDTDFVQTTEHFSSPSFWCNFHKRNWKTILIERAAPGAGIVSKFKFHEFIAKKFVLPNVDAFSALSSFAADNLRNLECKKNITIVPNAVDIRLFNIITPWNERKNIVIYVGRLIRKKLLDILIKSMPTIQKKIPDVELWIIGDGEYRNFYYSLAAGKAYIKFLGSKSRRELPHLYNQAKAFVMLYKEKAVGIGNATEEAMACGVPIIGSKNIPFDETKHIYYILSNHDSESLAHIIIRCLSEGESLSENARYVAKNTYSHMAIGTTYRKMIEKL
jgi:glycosyltransferase involved in cell wall biosynthesis